MSADEEKYRSALIEASVNHDLYLMANTRWLDGIREISQLTVAVSMLSDAVVGLLEADTVAGVEAARKACRDALQRSAKLVASQT